MVEKYAFWIKVLQYTNMNPVFKGGACIVVGAAALLFALFVKKRFNEPDSIFYRIFVGLCSFIVVYGMYILAVKPDWWGLPY